MLKKSVPPSFLHLVRGTVIPILIALSSGDPSQAKPIDTKAAESIEVLTQVIKRPPAERRLSAKSTEEFLHMAREDNRDQQVVGALALAFADDATSLTALKELAQDGELKNSVLGGAAEYAVEMREIIAGKHSKKKVFQLLSAFLHRVQNPFTRMFTANRMAVDFGERALPVILAAAKEERNSFVQCDMLYYLAQSGNPAMDDLILKQPWNENVEMPEDLAFIMGAMTPGRSKDQSSNSSFELLRKVRKRASNK